MVHDTIPGQNALLAEFFNGILDLCTTQNPLTDEEYRPYWALRQAKCSGDLLAFTPRS
jgi:hypothetical protein